VDSLVACGATSGVPGRPAPAARLTCAPNPSRGAQAFRWNPAAGFRQVTVFDTGGRRVRVLRAVGPAAGVSWDGRGEDGRPAAAGVYLVRAEGPAGAATARVVRLR
jgi:hypothetical protein